MVLLIQTYFHKQPVIFYKQQKTQTFFVTFFPNFILLSSLYFQTQLYFIPAVHIVRGKLNGFSNKIRRRQRVILVQLKPTSVFIPLYSHSGVSSCRKTWLICQAAAAGVGCDKLPAQRHIYCRH